MTGKPRAIDHLVLPTTTLALARSRLASLGFTVAPDARHPFGTANCCVFFKDRTFLEPITIFDRGAADMAAAEGLFFVKRLKRFTERRGEGFAMLALKSTDADADAMAFRAAGAQGGPVFSFKRKAALPDGSEREVGFALAEAACDAAPEATFFACRHLSPGALFQQPYLEHPNGAAGVAAASAVAEHPEDFRRLLAAATGMATPRADAFGLEALVDGHSIFVLTRAGFRARYGVESPDPRRGLVLAAFDVAVDDLDRAVGYAGPTARRHGSGIVVPPAPGLGAVLAFRAEEND
jgi:hypothetical protein